jgi:hypothetical protein
MWPSIDEHADADADADAELDGLLGTRSANKKAPEIKALYQPEER